MNRRAFLRSAAALAAGPIIVRDARLVRGAAANEKLNIALIGCGGRGEWFAQSIPKMENIVALCDVNEHKAKAAYEALPDVPRYADFRRMLDEKDKSIDAVIIAVPDHSHATAAMAAIRRGKHVFVEKPLAHNVLECRALRQAAARAKVATQMGNQGMSSGQFRTALEIVQAGLLGEVHEAYVWNSAGGRGKRQLPVEKPPCPPYLHWDLWLGPAAYRPYHPWWLGWSQWRDLGTGLLGLWGSHSMSFTFKAMNIAELWSAPGGPAATVLVESEVSEEEHVSFPRWEVVRYHVPARRGMPPLRITWFNGPAPGCREAVENLQNARLDWGDAGEKKWKDHGGALVVGSRGMLRLTEHNATFTLLPAGNFRDFRPPAPVLPRSPGHEREWLAACRGGAPAMSNFEWSGPLCELLMLGNVATRFPGKMRFDPVACRIIDNPAANGALGREYRQGWDLKSM